MTDRPSALQLQPLRVPSGWTVEYNDGLWEIDPDAIPLEDAWWVLQQDMLQLRHADRDRVVDVMWVAPADADAPEPRDEALARYVADGRYRLAVHAGDLRGPRLHAFETRDRAALVAEVERVLAAVLHRAL